uniref:Uncharacterized protein n=1 Tax=Fagus sylvatica TaxID=28930 RepID=A0A2N9GWD3_FAGSY
MCIAHDLDTCQVMSGWLEQGLQPNISYKRHPASPTKPYSGCLEARGEEARGEEEEHPTQGAPLCCTDDGPVIYRGLWRGPLPPLQGAPQRPLEEAADLI